MSERTPLVGIVGDSEETADLLKPAAAELEALGIPFEWQALSAHYTPDALKAYGEEAQRRGLHVIIIGETGNSQLAGMMKGFAGAIDVLAVLNSKTLLGGVDSAVSVLCLPAKAPVAIMGFDKAGAVNAAWFAADTLGALHPEIAQRMKACRAKMVEDVLSARLDGEGA